MTALGDLSINLVASAITGTAVFVWQLLRRRRRERRRRRFFGLDTRHRCAIYAPRYPWGQSNTMDQGDTAAMVEVAATARECGAEIEMMFQTPEEVQRLKEIPASRLGNDAEFTIGGPEANLRTAAHMETFLPGLTMDRHDQFPGVLPIRVGGVVFSRVRGKEEYVAFAKIVTDDGAPIFVLCGQTATGNHAAARYVSRGYRQLCRKYGATGQFCLVLKIVNSWAYGERKVELVADVTKDAFSAPTVRRDDAIEGGDRDRHTVADQEAHEQRPEPGI